MRTLIQQQIIRDYRSERRFGIDEFTASRVVRDRYASDLARTVAHGRKPTRAQLDLFRVADQWVATVQARPDHRGGCWQTARTATALVRTLRDANRIAVSA